MKYFLFFFSFLLFNQLQAQPGSLDNSFGNSGIALGFFTQDYNMGFGVYQQSDGKILNVGIISPAALTEDFYMIRYLPDGSPDSSFGINGTVSDPIGNADDQAFDVIQQADSKILLVGAYDNPIERDVFIRRYDSTGVLDTSFANGGMVTTDFQNGSDDGALRVRIQPDGKILVCGLTTETVNYTNAILVMRYNSDGTLDSTFGSGGKVSFSQLTGDQFASQFVLQPDGKIVVVGVTEDANQYFDILVVRFLSDGSLDNSFNGDGIYTFASANDDEEGWAIALQTDGKILIGGLATSINDEDDLLIRLDSTGYPDSTFNSTGILYKDHNQSYDYITSILIQPDGKIITVGQSSDLVEKISLTRYLSTGADDISFGNSGSILHSMGNDDSYSNSAILQLDNRIVISGWIETPNTSNNYVARFENDSLINSVSDFNLTDNKIFPNPAHDKIYIKNFTQGSHVTIFDSKGKVVYEGSSENNSVDVSHLTCGIYLLRTESDSKIITQKFIKH